MSAFNDNHSTRNHLTEESYLREDRQLERFAERCERRELLHDRGALEVGVVRLISDGLAKARTACPHCHAELRGELKRRHPCAGCGVGLCEACAIYCEPQYEADFCLACYLEIVNKWAAAKATRNERKEITQ